MSLCAKSSQKVIKQMADCGIHTCHTLNILLNNLSGLAAGVKHNAALCYWLANSTATASWGGERSSLAHLQTASPEGETADQHCLCTTSVS